MAAVANIPGWNYPRMEYVKQTETNICCHCNRMLFQPMQTACGHKLCSPCLEEMLAAAEAVPCPGNDETCEDINKYNVYPDNATFREMSRMEVHCPNTGCKVTFCFTEIQKHLVTCQFKTFTCTFKGCDFQGSSAALSEHVNTSSAQHTLLLNNALRDATSNHKEEIRSLREDSSKQIEELQERVIDGEKNNQLLQTRLTTMERELAAVEEQRDIMPQLEELKMKNEDMHVKQQRMEEEIRKIVQMMLTTNRMSGVTIQAGDAQNTAYQTVYTWHVTNYRQRKKDEVEGRTPYLDSETFYAGKYKMGARIYLNGDGIGKGGNLSLYLSLVKGEHDDALSWPFKYRISMILLNQLESNQKIVQEQFDPMPTSASYQKPKTSRNKGTGFPLFSTHALAESRPCLVDDSIKILIQVDSHATQQ